MLSRDCESREPLPDLEEILEGTCATCKAPIECLRAGVKAPRRTELATPHWFDLPSVECPKCGASVYLRKRRDQ